MLSTLIRTKRMAGEGLITDCVENLPVFTAPALTNTGLVEHLFTTRLGGVSKGDCASLNLSFSRGDDPSCVAENYRRVAGALHCRPEDIVATKQTHTTNILKVTKEDKGKGVVLPADYNDIDGLITNEEEIPLAVFTADCVPVLFLDKKNKAIGVAHCGWRGTAGKIGAMLINRMEQEYGSKPEDFLVAIGPSICQECYEVGEDVAEPFMEVMKGTDKQIESLREQNLYLPYRGGELSVLAPGKQPGKYQLDLWLANMLILNKAGIAFEQMSVTEFCTCHNKELLFSHRGSQGKRGNLGGFIKLIHFTEEN